MGEILFTTEKYQIINCNICGFNHLNPIPSKKEIDEFYQKKYFLEIKNGRTAASMQRLIDQKKVDEELAWLKSTLYCDIKSLFCRYLPEGSRNFCEIGCGSGHFLRYMIENGWIGIGIEPSENTFCQTKLDIKIFNNTLESFLTENPDAKNSFDAVAVANVLEHVIDPTEMLNGIKSLLNPNGIAYIRVPNDFSMLQLSANESSPIKNWWVAIPDHINYFTMESLEKFLIRNDFEILHKTTDFPMELFLLMGDNYVGNAEVGGICHKKRIQFDRSLSADSRMAIYSKFALQGIGRSCIFFVKQKNV